MSRSSLDSLPVTRQCNARLSSSCFARARKDTRLDTCPTHTHTSWPPPHARCMHWNAKFCVRVVFGAGVRGRRRGVPAQHATGAKDERGPEQLRNLGAFLLLFQPCSCSPLLSFFSCFLAAGIGFPSDCLCVLCCVRCVPCAVCCVPCGPAFCSLASILTSPQADTCSAPKARNNNFGSNKSNHLEYGQLKGPHNDPTVDTGRCAVQAALRPLLLLHLLLLLLLQMSHLLLLLLLKLHLLLLLHLLLHLLHIHLFAAANVL